MRFLASKYWAVPICNMKQNVSCATTQFGQLIRKYFRTEKERNEGKKEPRATIDSRD